MTDGVLLCEAIGEKGIKNDALRSPWIASTSRISERIFPELLTRGRKNFGNALHSVGWYFPAWNINLQQGRVLR